MSSQRPRRSSSFITYVGKSKVASDGTYTLSYVDERQPKVVKQTPPLPPPDSVSSSTTTVSSLPP